MLSAFTTSTGVCERCKNVNFQFILTIFCLNRSECSVQQFVIWFSAACCRCVQPQVPQDLRIRRKLVARARPWRHIRVRFFSVQNTTQWYLLIEWSCFVLSVFAAMNFLATIQPKALRCKSFRYIVARSGNLHRIIMWLLLRFRDFLQVFFSLVSLNTMSSSAQSYSYQLFGVPLLVPVPRSRCSYDVLYNCVLDYMSWVKRTPFP